MLRRAFGDPSVIASRDGGYALAVEPSGVDAIAALEAVATASGRLDAGDERGAADLCASTLRLFRGDVLSAAGDGDWVDPHRVRLEEARMKLLEIQFTARLRLGRCRRRDRRARSSRCDVPVPGEPVGAADHRAVPSRPSGGCPRDVPAGQEPAGRGARARSPAAAAGARTADPGPGPVAPLRVPVCRHGSMPRRRPGTCRR